MAFASFTDFCAALCGLLQTPPPALVPDENGVLGFTVTLHEARVSFMEGEYGREPAMLMAVAFGAPPPDKELEVLRSLMDANYLMTSMVPPAFVRNPQTGEISLHQCYLLSQVNVQSIYRGVANAAGAVRAWRLNPLLEKAQLPQTQLHLRIAAGQFA